VTRFGCIMSTSFVVLAIAGDRRSRSTPKLIWNGTASAPIASTHCKRLLISTSLISVAVDAPGPLAGFLSEREYLPRGVR